MTVSYDTLFYVKLFKWSYNDSKGPTFTAFLCLVSGAYSLESLQVAQSQKAASFTALPALVARELDSSAFPLSSCCGS